MLLKVAVVVTALVYLAFAMIVMWHIVKWMDEINRK